MNTYFQLKRQVFYGLGAVLLMLLAPSVLQARDYLEPGGDALNGAKIWANNCSRCHNMRDPQDLRDDQWITTAFHMRVRAGLTGQQTRDIMEFLQTANNHAVPAVDARLRSDSVGNSSGSDVYNQGCIACHGGDGKGTVPGSPTAPRIPPALSDFAALLNVNETNFRNAR